MSQVLVERRDRALWLELCTTAPRNALNSAAVGALAQALDGLATDDRAVVIHSRRPEFSAGWDVRDTASSEASMERVFELHDRIAELPVPVLAVVDGVAIGGAVGLVAACDLVVASTAATFSMPEARLGTVGAIAGTALAERVGGRVLGRLLIVGERLDAAAAERLGLADVVAPPDRLSIAVGDLLAGICRGSPAGVTAAKQLARRALPYGEDLRRLALALTLELSAGPELAEGTSAFFERRLPRWAEAPPAG